MSEIYFKHDCGLIMDKEAHDKIRKKTVFEKFEVTPCPQCKGYGGWKVMKKIGDNYEEIKFKKG